MLPAITVRPFLHSRPILGLAAALKKPGPNGNKAHVDIYKGLGDIFDGLGSERDPELAVFDAEGAVSWDDYKKQQRIDEYEVRPPQSRHLAPGRGYAISPRFPPTSGS